MPASSTKVATEASAASSDAKFFKACRARLTPAWGDFPFFYWYLLVIMPVTSLLLWLASLLQKRLTADSAVAGPAAGENGEAR